MSIDDKRSNSLRVVALPADGRLDQQVSAPVAEWDTEWDAGFAGRVERRDRLRLPDQEFAVIPILSSVVRQTDLALKK